MAQAALAVHTTRRTGRLAAAALLRSRVAAGHPAALLRRLAEVVGLVLMQGLIGVVQYHTGVPAVLVALHVAGAAACTAATAVLWASMRQRTEPQALKGRLDLQSEVALP
jgi:cytochrome c oxidase assembly protein subunit 15